MGTTLFLGFIVATFVTMVLIGPVVRIAQWLHIADMPAVRKVHEFPTPRLGGVAMAIGAALPLVMWTPKSPAMIGYLVGVAVIVAFGVWDDVRNIDYRWKFLGQIVAVLFVILHGGVVITTLPFLAIDSIPLGLAVPLTAFVLVGVTNAVNLADGLDGLAGGVTLLSLATIGILAYGTEDLGLLLSTVAVIGSIVGFLRFNTYPARIFMGDGGSQFLGFSAGVFVIILTQQANTALSPALPLMILGLPILDTLMVMTQRILEGRSPFLPDKNHIHHKLLSLGMNHYEAVFAIYIIQSVFVGTAYFLRFERDGLIAGLYALFSFVVILIVRPTTGPRPLQRIRRDAGARPAIPGWIARLRKDQLILRVAFYFAIVAIPSYLFLGAVFVEHVPPDIGALAWALLLVLVALYFSRRNKPFDIVERACAYVAGICVVYLVQVTPGALAQFDLLLYALFAAMTVAVAIGLRFSKERFRVTPMDFLVVLVALVVPILPDSKFAASNVGMSVAMLIVLLYAMEIVLNNISRRWDIMRLTTCLTLAVLGVRGIGVV